MSDPSTRSIEELERELARLRRQLAAMKAAGADQNNVSESEYHRTETELEQLSAHLLQVGEHEKMLLAQQIHDGLGQKLTALMLELSLLARSHSSEPARLEPVLAIAHEAIDEAQRLSASLRPPTLDELGLVAALQSLTDDFERQTEISCVLEADLAENELANAVATAVYRVVQQGLSDVARRGRAESVTVLLRQRGEQLILTIDDDGSDAESPGEQLGPSLALTTMRERVRILGGRLWTESSPEQGVTVCATIPVVRRAADDSTVR